jgi:hypothetical protein
MTVSLMIVNAQDAITVGELTFPAFGRNFQHFCHYYSFGWRTK